MSESTVKERLLAYLKEKRISQIEFTRNLGVSATYVGAMRKGISASKQRKLFELYPDLNRDWLLFGEGEMLRPTVDNTKDQADSEYEALLLPTEAFAGGLQMWSEGIELADCIKVKTPISGVDFAIPIKGDSMEPRFHDGSILMIKRINEKAFIPWGHPMVIDTENGVLIKKVMPDQDRDGFEECIVAESINPAYPPIKIPTASIYGMYRVLGTMEIYSNL